MERRKFMFKSLQTAVLALFFGKIFATATTGSARNSGNTATYFHYLLFWLDPALPPEKVKEFEQFFEELKQLPYQQNLRYGRPAKSSPRPVLDNSFTYNASMEFNSQEELEAYGQLPEHLALVKKYKPFFVKMMVHDSVYSLTHKY